MLSVVRFDFDEMFVVEPEDNFVSETILCFGDVISSKLSINQLMSEIWCNCDDGWPMINQGNYKEYFLFFLSKQSKALVLLPYNTSATTRWYTAAVR